MNSKMEQKREKKGGHHLSLIEAVEFHQSPDNVDDPVCGVPGLCAAHGRTETRVIDPRR